MQFNSFLRDMSAAAAALAFAGPAGAAAIPIEHGMTLMNPHGSLVFDIATGGRPDVGAMSFHELTDHPSPAFAKLTTFPAEHAGPAVQHAPHASHTHANAAAHPGNTGAFLGALAHKDVPAKNHNPFFAHLISGGHDVLQIDKPPGQFPISTNVPSPVPLPGALWLFGSAVLVFLGFANRRKL